MTDDKNKIQEETDSSNSFLIIAKKTWNLVRMHWVWFAISIVFFYLIARLFISFQPRVYVQSATLLSAASNGNDYSYGATDAVDALQEYNNTQVTGNLTDITMIIQSRRLVSIVIDSLDLQTNYIIHRGLTPVMLYDEKPFHAFFSEGMDRNVSFNVDIISPRSLRISHFKLDGEDNAFTANVSYGSPIRTPAGSMVLEQEDRDPDFIGQTIRVDRITKEEATMHFFHNVNAGIVDKEASLISVSCNDGNPTRANRILTVLLNVFKADVVNAKNQSALSMASFLQVRMDSLGNQLGDIEARLAVFKKNHQVVAYEDNAKAFLKQSADAQSTMHDLESQMAVVHALQSYLKRALKPLALIPMLDGLDRDMLFQINSYNTLVLEYNKLANPANYASPIIQSFNRDVLARREAITASVNNSYNTLLAQHKRVESEYHRVDSLLRIPPKDATEFDELKRQQKILGKLYLYLLNLREEVGMQLAINVENVRVVEGPTNFVIRTSPKSTTIYYIALALSLIFPYLFFRIRMMMDFDLHDRKEVEQVTDLPILAEIPSWKKTGADDNPCFEPFSDDPVVDAFRILRYNIDFVRGDKNVILVTASTPGQGKSFISRNLSVVCAMAGKRVVLLDADIRKLTQTKIVDNLHHRSMGLTNYLEGSATLDDIIIRSTLFQGVDFIPGGTKAPNPSELLLRGEMGMLIDELRKRYDYVIIDTTPAFSVADAQIVAHHVDLTLFVLRVGVEHRSFPATLNRLAAEQKFPHLTLVINDAKDQTLRYGYGHDDHIVAEKFHFLTFIKRLFLRR